MAAAMEDDSFTIELPWPSPAEESDDEEPAEAQNMPHELDELLGEFVDVLYGAGDAPGTGAGTMGDGFAAPDDATAIDVSVDATSSLPPSSPASLSQDSVTVGWGSEEAKPRAPFRTSRI